MKLLGTSTKRRLCNSHSGAIHREVEGLRSLNADLGLGSANRINISEPTATTERRKERKKENDTLRTKR
ncbi:hypothetical protein ACSTS3_09635 [Aquimarina muelleri]|uniref:hypothetical protein n=1 Tax=Aquimarina muelleri TaxID=279356 RepID=UPI003F682547